MNHISDDPIRWVGILPRGTRAFIAIIIKKKGYTTEDCRTLRDRLGQLVKVRKLSQFLHQPVGQFGYLRVGYQRDGDLRPSLGTINVIFSRPKGDVGTCSRVMSVAVDLDSGDRDQTLKKAKVVAIPILGFFKGG